MLIENKKIVEYVCGKKYSPMNAKQLAANFDFGNEDFKDFCSILHDLEFKGEIVKVKDDQYACPKKVGLLIGVLECKSQGFGFVIPVKESVNDIYVNEESMGEAMHGDLVVVRLPGKKVFKGKNPKWDSGKIVKILNHANDTIIGLFKKNQNLNYVVPDNSALFKDVYVSDADANGAGNDDKVIVKIVQWPTRHLNPHGVVTKILGKEGTPGVDIDSIIYQFQFPHVFNDDIKKELENISEDISEIEIKNRVDLRQKTVITIDPDDAKDFDDAVSVEKSGKNWLLGVHIADVSYYVKPGSAIDKEAKLRGNSIYFPEKVIPMLPEKLSNGICSLKEGEDRLAKSVFLTFDSYGNWLGNDIRNTVIRVKKRFNYNEVTKLLDEFDNNTTGHLSEDIKDLLVDMKSLREILFKKRMKRGSIELDLPEVDLKLDNEGNIVDVIKSVKDLSHSIIEEFMLIANEAVANFTREKKLPCLYRSHNEPDEDDMHGFADFIKGLKRKKLDPFDRVELQRVLDDAAGKPEAYAVNLMLLKSFKRAEYSINEYEHYALAIENYTHFTSPIRRYPDLFVHRSLDKHFSEKRDSGKDVFPEEYLKELASHCSYTERRAEEAEREIIKVKLIRHIGDKINEVMDGIITGVEEYGFFVQIQENLLEGLVHVRTLTDDFYVLDKKNVVLKGFKKKNIFRIGDKVKVEICNVDKLKKQVDFKVVN